jgi:Cu+-exporting ATPase
MSVHSLSPSHTHVVNGLGVKATVKGVKVLVGNERWLTQTHSVILDEDAKHEMRRVCDRGSIGVYVALDGVCAGIVALSDPLKRNALDVVRGLRAAGVDVYIVTGDNRRTANVIAGMVEIPPHRVISEATPAGKAAAVKDLRAQRKTVMFVGDGVNDAPALAHADVSVAIGTGTDIAVEAASVVLMKSDLNDILVAFDLSRHVLRRIHINFVFAIVYNLVSIPFAAGMFFPVLHIQIHPAMAALMMGMSSVSVVLSSLWLKRYTPPANPHSSSIRAHARSRGAAGAPTSRNGGYSELFQDLPGPALGDMTTSDDDLGMDHV